MGKIIDLVGKKYGRLTVLSNAGKTKKFHALWLCKCDCGNEVIVLSQSLRTGNTSSCGCLHVEKLTENNKINKITHGLTHTRLYRIWGGMKRRCYEICNKDYARYGLRGITICNEWLVSFQSFYDWAMSNGYKDDLSIDRIENDGNYEVSNCKWATIKVQNNNRSSNHLITFNGKTQNIKQWADEIGVGRITLSGRINKLGWSLERALAKQL